MKTKTEGIVRIKIAINYKGKVVDTQLMTRLGKGCDEEGERIVRLMQWEIDHKVRKGKELFHKILIIHFKLPKTNKFKPKENVYLAQINNNIIPKVKPSSTPKPKIITYTVNY